MSIDGLKLDTRDVLAQPPSVVIYGAPGLGKSTEMARAFQRVLYVQSAPGILKAYAHWASLHPEMKMVIPARITLDEQYVANFGGSWTTALVDIINRYIASCDSGKCPYEGIVFDEWNTICERIFAELKTDPWGKFKGRNGNLNIFAVFDYFKVIHRSALSISRRTGRMAGFVSHYQLPKIDDDDTSPTKGMIKWRGGPKMPMGLSDQAVELCAEADVVIQLELKDKKPDLGALLGALGAPAAPPAATPAASEAAPLSLSLTPATPAVAAAALTIQPPAPVAAAAPTAPTKDAERVFYTQLDTKWFRKVRGFNIMAEEPLDIHSGKGLRELLKRAGYPV